MYKRYWDGKFAIGLTIGGLLAIVLLVWVVGLNYCPGSPCQHNTSPDSDPNDNEYWVPFALGPDSTSQPNPADTEGHEDWYTYQDLRAQETMARATNAIVVLTGISLIIGVCGTGLLVWTLIETRKTASEAATTTLVSIEALRQNRAWVLRAPFDNIEMKDATDDEGKFDAIGYRIKFQNFGRTPARNVRFGWGLKILDIGDSVDRFDVDISHSETALLGQGEVVHHDILWGRSISAAIRGGEKLCVFYLKITYQDIFVDTVRCTEFCARMVYNPAPGAFEGRSEPKVSLQPIGQQNNSS